MEGIDPAERMDILENTLPLMEENKPSQVKFQDTHLMIAFSLIPASERSNASHFLFNLKNHNPKTFDDITQSIKHYIQFLLANPRLKPVLFEYWHKLLSSPNEQLVKRLTDLTIFSMEEFGLDEQDMIVQEAIRVRILLDDPKDPRSPFKFYKELQEKRSQPIDLDEIKVLQERFDGQKLCLNPFYFQKLSRENSEGGVQFKNLPAYSKNFLSKMTESLEKK
jgi:hypothetical protein